ncbi:hypothetical protein DTO013E5_5379 [Penicillium roqueforti]|uniref:uncharacterized protein n=1 Tax=Penicillium roqueforti TaxID=5082 RepID=UPI00190ABD75|nr:uncharacterized protein LCP9604111_3501 [Penicillium roqueforti]KAF9250599.1 hypothetical protein LCP9604111_3501 [Penicillium roqueforti]KAI1829999.1 hypothetical protein CBS147337_9223 [Penicillium roqueforti]KAI2672621.1 hypothetical protein CBS147355_7948 [Penicillium roqueforti]KAI2678929.1 hypothetical protein LCP963914a_7508 [Penicillium roqueforti]KAI2716529.1 hypothetical protein CBS147318_5643 [Penicillium roqueforti]
MNAAAQGDKASAESNYPIAIEHYTHALSELPRAPAYYISRSTAYSRLKPANGGPNYQAALEDAEIALQLAKERGNREFILSAQMRRAVSLYQLERYGDAGFVFEIIADKTKSEQPLANRSEQVQAAMGGPGSASKGARNNYSAQLPIWTAKIQRKLAELPKDDPKCTVSVTEFPSSVYVPTGDEMKAQWKALKAGNVGVAGASQTKTQPAEPQQPSAEESGSTARLPDSSSAAAVSVAPEKVRHEWYQSQDSVVVTLYAKGIPKDSVAVDLKEDLISLQFPLPSGSEYDFTLDPLYAAINPAESKVSVKGTKIELTLRKQKAGQKWGALEGSATNPAEITDRPAAQTSPAPTGPSYPTSSRSGPKDWDKVASSLTAKPKADGNADVSDDEGGDAVDGFFKKLYAGADPETRRAMIKSYTESQGTSLSTNWSEVAKGKVEAHPE